jgi:hypothetical protein
LPLGSVLPETQIKFRRRALPPPLRTAWEGELNHGDRSNFLKNHPSIILQL